MQDAQLIFAPFANSYRRFQPGSFAPDKVDWGFGNRGTAIRIPDKDGPAAIGIGPFARSRDPEGPFANDVIGGSHERRQLDAATLSAAVFTARLMRGGSAAGRADRRAGPAGCEW